MVFCVASVLARCILRASFGRLDSTIQPISGNKPTVGGPGTSDKQHLVISAAGACVTGSARFKIGLKGKQAKPGSSIRGNRLIRFLAPGANWL